MEGPDRKIRDMESLDFYKEWCRIQFGEDVSEQAASIFSSLDGLSQKSIKLQGRIQQSAPPC